MKLLIFLTCTLLCFSSFARKKKSEKVIYKYRKYQKFDFEDLTIEGETGSPGDISISSRFQKRFKNKLPYRRNFHPEMVRDIERLR